MKLAKGGVTSLASGGAFQDIQAYEGPMPTYSYVNGQGLVRTGTERAAPVRQLIPMAQPVAPVQAPVQSPVQAPTAVQPMMETSGGGYTPNPDFVTPEQQAAFYRDNPTMAGITQTFQRYNPFASLQEYMDPGFTERQGIIAAGLRPNQNFGVPGFDYTGDSDSFASERAAVDRARPGLVDGGLQDPQQRAEIASETNSGGNVGDGVGRNSDGTTGLGDSSGRSSGGGDGIDGQDGDGTNPSGDVGGDVGGESGPGVDSMAEGGLLGRAKGGMKAGGFVVPADVVSMVGEGNTDAGYRRIMALLPGATPIKGADGGQSDTVKTNIEGKQPARVAHGEMYVPPEVVKKAGGAKKLYAMMDKVRQQATGSKKQIKPVRLERAMA